MFHFPAYTPTQAMNSPAGNTTQLVLGFPIRTSSDQRLVGNSPRHNAASHVLHRLSMPRHPPYALNKKHYKTHTQKIKMLASTIQFSHTTPQPPTRAHTHTSKRHQDHKETTHMLPQTPNSAPTHIPFLSFIPGSTPRKAQAQHPTPRATPPQTFACTTVRFTHAPTTHPNGCIHNWTFH